jgi:IclR family KDG regulon transcriptional repressor
MTVVRSEEPLGITDLSRSTGFDRAAVYRLMQPLLRHSFVAREPNGKRYLPGPGLVEIWATAMGRDGLRGSARAAMERIAERTNETVSLHLRDDQHRVCIDTVEGRQPIRRVVPLGERLPLYAGPTGKVILAFLPEAEVEAILALAAADGEDVERTREQLEEVRAKGYLAAVSDRIVGVGGLSVPVFNGAGVVAAVTASGPARRFSSEAMEEVAGFVSDACADISNALGSVGKVGALR